MVKNKREQNINLSIYRTSELRKLEVRIIMDKLKELQLSMDYRPIKKLYELMFNYIRSGEKTIVNIPFPEIHKRIEGVLATNINEECVIRLKCEKF
jgi:hypothetical protein